MSETPSTGSGPSATPASVSLDALKDKMKTVSASSVGASASIGNTSKDRAATPDDMNKLKNLISAVTVEKLEKIEKKEEPIPVPKKPTNEVPEDVLRKILE